MTSKYIVVDVVKGYKLDDNNYNIWCRKIQYLFIEYNVLKTLEYIIMWLEEDNIAQHR